jgi:hypothetical protein
MQSGEMWKASRCGKHLDTNNLVLRFKTVSRMQQRKRDEIYKGEINGQER